MSDAFRSIISMSISGSLVALTLFALKPLCKDKLSKQLQYYLWLIVIAQLLLPFSWEISVIQGKSRIEGEVISPVFSVRETVDKLVLGEENSIENKGVSNPANFKPVTNTIKFQKFNTVEKTADLKNPTSFAMPLVDIVLTIGILLSLSWTVFSYLLFVRQVKKTIRATDINIRLPVFKSSMATTPMLIGIIKPFIVLPENQFSQSQLEFILSHELAHYKRKDILIKWLTNIAVAIHWFNPLLYFIRCEINRACELSCDEIVIKALDNTGKQGYGDTLISVVSHGRIPQSVATTTMNEDKKNLKDRLISIMNYKKQSKFLVATSVILVSLLLACAFVLAAKNGVANVSSISKNKSLNQQSIVEIINKNLDIITSAPNQVSNIHAYIRIHNKEYLEIVGLGKKALPYLYSIYEKDNDLKSIICREAMFDIQPDLNLKSAESEGKYANYRIETVGIDFNNPIDGIYPAKGVQLVDTSTNKVIWSNESAYIKTDFAWSPDGRYVAMSCLEKDNSNTKVFDIKTMSFVPLPGLFELSQISDRPFMPIEDTNHHIWLYKWTYDMSPRLQMTFEWTAQNNKQVQGGFAFDMFSKTISNHYAEFKPKPTTIDYSKSDELEIKYDYFNYFEKDYNPYVTRDKKIIETVTGLLENSVPISKLEYQDISRPNNATAYLTLYNGNKKQTIELKIDSLYCKSAFEISGLYYSPGYDIARLIQNLEEIRPDNMNVDESVESLFSNFGLSPAFKISTNVVNLPENLLYKNGEFPIKLYWSYNLELSKDIGLDFSKYFGKNLKIQQYYLFNPLPEDFRPQWDTYAVVLWDGDKIVGGYLNGIRNEFACSLSQNSFHDIKGMSFEKWFAINGYDMKEKTNINNSKLSPEEVITKYYDALNKDPRDSFQYLSIEHLKSYLYSYNSNLEMLFFDWNNEKPFEITNNINSVKLLSIEKSNEPEKENQKIFNVTVDMQYKQEVSDNNGIQRLNIWLVNEGKIGWKVVAAGH